MPLHSPLLTFGYAAGKVYTQRRRHSSPLRSGEYFGPYKYPPDCSFSLHTPFSCPFYFLSCFLCSFCRSTPLDRPTWLPRSPPKPNDSDPVPPRWRHHPLRKIHIGSFPERPSGSITSRYSTARSSPNAVSPLLMHSSTSSSKTVAGRHYVRPLFQEWPRSMGVPLQSAFQGQHHRLRSGQVGRVWCPGHQPDLLPDGWR